MSDDVNDFFNNPVNFHKNPVATGAPQPVENPLDTIPTTTAPPPGTGDKKLSPSVKDTIIKLEHLVLRTLSVVLILHGLTRVYEGFVEIFYIFPHLPEIFKLSNYSSEIYTTVYRRAAVITATAIIETIYGTILLAKYDKLYHRLHIFTVFALLAMSLYLFQGLPKLDPAKYPNLPKAPTYEHLIEAKTMEERLQLFKNIQFKPAEIPSLDSTSSAQKEPNIP